MFQLNKKWVMSMSVALGMGLSAVPSVQAAEWVTTYDAATYLSSGTITFNDWGFTGPNGRNAMDFSSINGFGGPAQGNAADPSGGLGQIQDVVTRDHDWRTPDAPQTVYGDVGSPNVYTNANMDTATNFYQWAYTSPGGSTFNNMMIDYDGDYFVNQNDMNFQFYSYFDYQQEGTTGGLADGRYQTKLAFQPYALSDATGWCGSILASHPNALEAMAGQLTFDVAFDVYQVSPAGKRIFLSTEIIKDFKARSYGELTVDVTTAGGELQQFSASAVVNNTNPTSGNASVGPGTPVDPDYHNIVSFMGGDVIAAGGTCGVLTAEWAAGQRGPGVKRFSSIIDSATDQSSCSAAGGAWSQNAFSGFAFILRADGERTVTYFDEARYGPDPYASPVPVPAAVWLFGSGLVSLGGLAWRKKATAA